MDHDILENDKNSLQEIIPESPGVAISRNDLRLAQLIKTTKTGLNNLVGDNRATS